SSKYRGVTRHRRTKRWEAHIWDDKKQVYLGGFDVEEHAGKAHDVMALKCRGPNSPLNFAQEEYDELLPMLPSLTKDEVVLLLRRQSKGFAKGTSKYRGVVKQRSGKWDGRMGQYPKRKYMYVGVYGGIDEGAAAYERTAGESNSGHSVSNL
ncbi:AP2-domain-containing protein, partial [Coccomyxa subellipsoidea C-169]